jgi:hypothetical protein
VQLDDESHFVAEINCWSTTPAMSPVTDRFIGAGTVAKQQAVIAGSPPHVQGVAICRRRLGFARQYCAGAAGLPATAPNAMQCVICSGCRRAECNPGMAFRCAVVCVGSAEPSS